MLRSLVLIAGLGLVPKLATPAPGPVTFRTADGVTIYGQTYASQAQRAPVILAFHQAGSNKNEYAPLAPQLVALGFSVLAIDQRSGGNLFEPTNETVQHLGRSTDDDPSVLPDLEATLAYAKRAYPASPIIAWGSSYSASLVVALAAKHPHDLAAIVVFSPGEYFSDKRFVERAAHHVTVPAFIDTASDPSEIASARTIFRALASRDKTQYLPKAGIHGSSTLRADRDPAGAAENWQAVTAFLQRVGGKR